MATWIDQQPCPPYSLFRRLRLNLHCGTIADTYQHRYPQRKRSVSDSLAVWRVLQQDFNIRAEETIIYGRSLGGGVASYLATYDDFAALFWTRHLPRRSTVPRSCIHCRYVG